MVLLKFKGVKWRVFPSSSSKTKSTIFTWLWSQIPTFIRSLDIFFPFYNPYFKVPYSQTWKQGNIITEYKMQNYLCKIGMERKDI